MVEQAFWNNKNVFVTGHTGFKGSWLCLLLCTLGAKVTGYSLDAPTKPSMFELCHVGGMMTSICADIRDKEKLREAIATSKPDIVIHMAAQPLVRDSYQKPADTYEINLMGTVYLLEAVRDAVCNGIPIRSIVNVTTDKCYENKEWLWGYRENDTLGGYDPYSNSKACSELITSAYRSSFFHPAEYPGHGVGLATARAGNVIGGGDWAADRLLPDCFRSLLAGEEITVRNPAATRPWQHVLEPLRGYLLLAQKLYENGPEYSGGWNFGPDECDVKPVSWVVQTVCDKWGGNSNYRILEGTHPHEAKSLQLDCSKAKQRLGWRPRWSLETAIDKVIQWVQCYVQQQDLTAISLKQIEEYSRTQRTFP